MAAADSEQQVSIELSNLNLDVRDYAKEYDATYSDNMQQNKTADHNNVISGPAAPVKPAYDDLLPEGPQMAVDTAATSKAPINSREPVRRVPEEHPYETVCTSCGKIITTQISYEPGTCTYLSCFALAFFGCVFGCCLLPFCMRSFQDATHACPHCHAVVGKNKKCC